MRDEPRFSPEWAPTGNSSEALRRQQQEIRDAAFLADADRPDPTEFMGEEDWR